MHECKCGRDCCRLRLGLVAFVADRDRYPLRLGPVALGPTPLTDALPSIQEVSGQASEQEKETSGTDLQPRKA